MKILEHLAALTPTERKHLHTLSKIWQPKAYALQRLLRNLIDELDKSDINELNKNSLNLDSSLSRKSLQNMQTKLIDWFKRFLSSHYYYEENYTETVAYIKFCLDKEIDSKIVSKYKNRPINNKDFKDSSSLQEMYSIYHTLYYHPLVVQKQKKDDPIFDKMFYYMNAYQRGLQLEHQLEVSARNVILPINEEIVFPTSPDIIDDYPLFSIYKLLIEAYSSLSIESIIEAKEGVWEHLNSFSRAQKAEFLHNVKNLYAHLIRNKKINQQLAANYLFEHYKLLDENQLITEGGKIQPRTFTNIANVAIRMKEYKWIEEFANRYQQALPKADRNVILALTKADILFSKREFKKAISTLPKRTKDPLTEIRCKGLEICCMVELQMDEYAIVQKCKTLSTKLGKSPDISQEILDAARVFLNIVRKLIFREKGKSEIQDHLNRSNEVFFYDWLQSRVSSYKTYGIS